MAADENDKPKTTSPPNADWPAPKPRMPALQPRDESLPKAAPEAATRDKDDAPQVPSLPSPSLPKGGGSVRGLGETFKVNAANGTFTASIPISAPAARGFDPQLSLGYDSGAGNGPFSEGWSVPLGSVARKTDKVLPRYRPDDVFVAGGEDLVPSLTPDGDVWAQGARDAGTHLVQCYRPRVEEAYDRIERWTRKSDGDVHWRIRTKDGRTSVYGEAPVARVAAPSDASHVYRWLIERTFDDRGNLVHYRYRNEDRLNVAPAIWEQHRAPVYVHIDRILYGNRAPYDPSQPAPDDPTGYLFEVVFDYGERDGIAADTEPPYVPPSTWTVRVDPYSAYKPGFELRCYRLCKRILTFSRTSEAPQLTRELRLRYNDDPSLNKLVGVTSVGWRAGTSIAYPEVELGYSVAAVDPTVREIAVGSAENLPPPVDGQRARWVDLDGEGIPGALVEDRPGWFYKRNLGSGALAPVEALPTRPRLDLTGGGQLLDVNGDGTKSLVRFDRESPGLFARNQSFSWDAFSAFESLPNVDFEDPNLRFIDLDGDGRIDVLISDDDVLRWYPSLGYDGFGDPALVAKPHDEARGPALVFADAEQSIFLADMSGDGLTDLVRIRNGQVCYWPNLGYGRFGAKITMGNAPLFASAFDFSQANLRLADIDGSGTTDILYCDGARIRYWLNLAGNSFSAEQSVAGLPYDSAARIDAVDLLGNGTSCLVWTSPLPWHARQPLRYIDLTGGIKPHLLQSIDNGLGRAVSVEYAASTRFYLEDRAAGHPWITRVPFPVQVVATLTTIDQIGGNQVSCEYSYHHGFYDGFEREFRGFGMVEQRDSQTLSQVRSQGRFPAGVDFVPPTRTRTWFHTGAFVQEPQLIARYRQEWFNGDPDQAQLADGIIPSDLDAEELREALRSLRGRALRVETYADDVPATAATAIPYSIVESNYRVRTLQRRGGHPHAVFVCDPLETLRYDYERNVADPRVDHRVVLRVGAYGAVEQEAHVGYPRRGAVDGMIVAYSERDWMARDGEAELYRINVAAETRLYEVTGLTPPGSSPFVLSRAALQSIPSLAGTADDIAYDRAPNPALLQRRIVRRRQLFYYGDDDTTPLPVGSFGARALVRQSHRAIMPLTMAPAVLPPTVDAAMLAAAGYVQHDSHWWAPSNTIGYAAASFYQPTRFTDPFNTVSRVDYDPLQLLPATITNALNQSVAVVYDYLAFAPSSITDVNGNAWLAAYDALGRLRDVARTGKNGEGDTLAAPTTHHEYTLTDWKTSGTPNHSHTTQRLVHGADGFAERIVYGDGFDRELMTKVKANPGSALQVQDGIVVSVQTTDRWIASGRSVYDNKGNSVRRYEPFYAVGSQYEPDPQLAFLGVSAVQHYDPLGRLVRTDFPDGTFATVELGAWEQRELDGADHAADETQLWVNRPGQSPADQRATAATLLHRRTPTRHVGDALGRRVSTFADNTQQDPLVDTPEASHVLYETRRVLDLQGQPLQVFDDRGLHAAPPYATLTQTFDMAGSALRRVSAESGTAYSLSDCLGKPFYARDARGIELTWSYDLLRRPTANRATDTANGTSFVAERTVYGDDGSVPPNATANLLGHVYQTFDQVGIVTNSAYDFKGNLLRSSRQLIAAYKDVPDWTAAYLTPFSTSIEYDAVDRVVRATLPRRNSSTGNDNVIARQYLVQGALSSITVTAQYGAAAAILSNVEYDAKGRRISADYGNGVTRTYSYDPLTFRLTSVSAARNGTEPLQSIVYTYDAVGNITEIADTAQETVFNRNQQIDPRIAYTFDSIYRLTDCSAREMHDATQPADGDLPFGVWPADANDLVNYSEHYDYDTVGNLLSLVHRANNNTQGWTRDYGYDLRSNRLTGTSLPGAVDPTVLGASYGYDAAGNMIAMPHLSTIGWDEHNRLAAADQVGGGIMYCRHVGAGLRGRKVQTRATASGEMISYERIYIGDYELYRVLDASGNATTEVESVHAFDGDARVVLIETQTSDASPAPVMRYQLDNHLGSATVELDANAQLLSYEEYHPFGTTAFHARASIAEVSLKRYRFLDKERDDETGLYYCTARHYCAWLGRWISPDPAGLGGGLNLYAYSDDNPIVLRDANGREPTPANDQTIPVGEIKVPIPAAAKRFGLKETHVPQAPTVSKEVMDKYLHPTPPQKPPPPKAPTITDFYPNWPWDTRSKDEIAADDKAAEIARQAQIEANKPPPFPPPTATDPALEAVPKSALDFQVGGASGYDISGYTPTQFNVQLGWPNVGYSRSGRGWDRLGSSHHLVNYLSTPAIVGQYQSLSGPTPPPGSDATYRQGFSVGAQVNAVDVQLRTSEGRPILDVQVPIQAAVQGLWDPLPRLDPMGRAVPGLVPGFQATGGLGLDFHLDGHLSILAGVSGGVGYNPVNGWGPAFSATVGLGIHFADQTPTPYNP